MRVAVRIAGLVVATAFVLWCAVIAIRSFTPQAGAGLPRLDGGVGLQALLGLAALTGAGLATAAAFTLARPACRFGQPLWLVVSLLGWAALAAGVASRAADLLLAPADYELGVPPGTPATVAPTWQAWFWTTAGVCAALAGALLVRWAVQERATNGAERPTT